MKEKRAIFVENKLSNEELLAQISALKRQANYLSTQNENLSQNNKDLKQKIDKLEKINQHYLEQLRLSKKKIFGASSEQMAEGYEQLKLFNEAESERTPLLPEPKIEEVIVPSHKRKKKRSFDEKYGDLPAEEVVYDISDKEKICEKCGSEMTFMKYEIRRELKIIPAKITVIAGQGFLYIEKLFSLEHIDSKKPLECSKLSLADISEIRKKQSKELLSEFFSWAESEYEKSLPQSLVGKALSYAINQKSTLIAFLKNSKLELTNNRAERSIKPFVIGRKNWLFCNTPGGANSSAIVYSIIETAKENNLKPYDYLVWLFEKIRSGDDVETLLPWSDDLPKSLKLKTE